MTTDHHTRTVQPPADAAPFRPADAANPCTHGTPCPTCGERLSLTRAQRRLLTLDAYGLTVHEMASRYTPPVSTSWVHGQLTEIAERLGATTRAHAVDIACRAGLLRPRAGTRPTATLTPLQTYVVLSLARGNTREQTRTLLEIGPARFTTALRDVHERLGLGQGQRRTRLMLYLLHSEKALPSSNPCRCRPDEPLPPLKGSGVLLRPSPRPPTVRGRPCPRCGSRARLTVEHRDVLELMARGLTDQEIAGHLGSGAFATRTTAAVRHSLGARNRAQAVDLGYRHGFLAPPDPLPEPLTVTDPDTRAALARIAAGWTIHRTAASIGLTRQGLLRRLSHIHEHFGTTGEQKTIQALYLLHALGGVLPDEHPCPCPP
ncbi:hypothetical protein ACFCX4_03435 [Kitasatospora sp. NPDC056327]|uniref:hypothetical protein n=1 Tax=Kitasatospora sp. NPDC056327 TaxID=3345785 RepID=UPI0035D820B7